MGGYDYFAMGSLALCGAACADAFKWPGLHLPSHR